MIMIILNLKKKEANPWLLNATFGAIPRTIRQWPYVFFFYLLSNINLQLSWSNSGEDDGGPALHIWSHTIWPYADRDRGVVVVVVVIIIVAIDQHLNSISVHKHSN